MAKQFHGEIIGGGNRGNHNNRQPGLSGIDFWEQAFPNAGTQYNAAEEILKFPTDDIGGIMARCNFKKKSEVIAFNRLFYKTQLFKDDAHKNFYIDCAKAPLGLNAAGKTIQLQSQTQLIAPELMREQLGLKKNNKGEKVSKSSDFDTNNNNQQEVHKQ